MKGVRTNLKILAPLLVVGKVFLDDYLQKGVGISVAAAKREGRYLTHLQVSNYDNRCLVCMPDPMDRVIEKLQRREVSV